MGLRLMAAVAACLFAAACGTPPPGQVPPRGGSAAEAGRAQALSFLEVVGRVEPVAEAECRSRNPGANCDFAIVVDDRRGMPPNAYQTLDRSGRPILAVTAALVAVSRNSDELALVLSHEASHHIAGHLARQDRNASLGAAAFGRIASQEAGATPESVARAQMLGAQVGARTFSREFELEADRLGAIVAARAGFDPVRGAEFFLRIPDPGNRRFGTHPSNAERIAVVREAVAGLG
jgi:predicted Zn-dependent protease